MSSSTVPPDHNSNTFLTKMSNFKTKMDSLYSDFVSKVENKLIRKSLKNAHKNHTLIVDMKNISISKEKQGDGKKILPSKDFPSLLITLYYKVKVSVLNKSKDRKEKILFFKCFNFVNWYILN